MRACTMSCLRCSCWGGCCCCRTARCAGGVLLVPLVYLGWAMLVAAMTGQAPYPFLELQRLGLAAFLLNVLRVAGVFVVGWTLLWGLDRWRRR